MTLSTANHYRPGVACNAMGKAFNGADQSIDAQSASIGDQSVGKLTVCQQFDLIDDSILALVLAGSDTTPFNFGSAPNGTTFNDAASLGFHTYINTSGGQVVIPGTVSSPNYSSVTGRYTVSKPGVHDIAVQLQVAASATTANFAPRLLLAYLPAGGTSSSFIAEARNTHGTGTAGLTIPLELVHSAAFDKDDQFWFVLYHNVTGNADVYAYSPSSTPANVPLGRLSVKRNPNRV